MSPSSVIYSSDRSVVRAWSGPLTAAGTRVQVIDQLGQVGDGADLLVAQAGAAPADLYRALTTVKAEHPSLVVLQQPSLPVTLDCMRLPSTRGVVVESYLDARLLTYLAAKLLRGDIFGVAKVMPWGTRIYTEMVNNHDERAQALAKVSAYIRSLGLRAKYREAVELVLDELLMNALYNAPVGADGKQLFMEVAPTDRGSLRLERPVVLQYACDGVRFAAGVRDGFGSLRRETVLSYLIRCASSPDDQIERKTSGAGLGLWLVANNATEVVVNLSPGSATEVVTVFDLRAPRQQLMHFGFYEEPSPRTGAEATTAGTGTKPLAKAAAPSTRPSRMVQVVLLFALGLLVVAVALLIVPLMRGPGKGTLEVTVNPGGSAIYVNGVQRGTASPTLSIPDLDTGRYTIQAKRSGYREVQELVSVATGQKQLVSLVLQKRRSKLRLTSTPTGAQVFLDGRATGLETPVELDDLDPGRAYTVRLQRLGNKPTTKEVNASDDVVRVHVELPPAEDFAQLTLDSNPPGARFLVNNLDTGLVTPVAGYNLRAGQSYKLRLTLPGRVLWEESVEPKPGETVRRSATLDEGGMLTFAANVRGRLFLGDDFQVPLPLHQKPVPAGAHKARIRGDDPYVDAAFDLPIKAGESVTRRMQFGFVQTKRKGLTIKVDKRRSVTRIALLPGEHELKLHDVKTGQTRPERVEVTAGKTITLE
jgi:hypothetical protein